MMNTCSTWNALCIVMLAYIILHTLEAILHEIYSKHKFYFICPFVINKKKTFETKNKNFALKFAKRRHLEIM